MIRASLGTRQLAPIRSLFSREALRSDTALLMYLALITFIGHMLVAGNYGYFRDELYYLEGGRHLAFGYVDFEPMIALLAAITNVLFHDNLVAIHIFPALGAASLVVVTGLMARELGGGRFAQLLAAIASMFAVVYMATGSIFSMDVLDELWWAVAVYLVIRIIRRNEPRLWLLFGVVAGIGLMTKLTILFFGLSLVIGLLLTPQRRVFRMRWIWLGGAIALAIFTPYLVWNTLKGWPTWTFWHNYGGLGTSPLDFFVNQFLLINLLSLPIAVAGFFFYFRTQRGKPYRALGWTVIVLYVLLTLTTAKPYFFPPIYPTLFAGGACVFERIAEKPRWHWLTPTYPALIVLSGLFFAPLAMPVLPPSAFVSHYGFLTGAGNSGAGQNDSGQFPQYLGDRFGWDSMAATVAKVYQALPPDQQAQACILTQNYGEASALDLLGSTYHLPPTISGHNNFYYWGPGKCSGRVLIVVNYPASDLEQSYQSVALAATNSCAYCMSNEDSVPIYVCSKPTFSHINSAWQRIRHFS